MAKNEFRLHEKRIRPEGKSTYGGQFPVDFYSSVLDTPNEGDGLAPTNSLGESASTFASLSSFEAHYSSNTRSNI